MVTTTRARRRSRANSALLPRSAPISPRGPQTGAGAMEQRQAGSPRGIPSIVVPKRAGALSGPKSAPTSPRSAPTSPRLRTSGVSMEGDPDSASDEGVSYTNGMVPSLMFHSESAGVPQFNGVGRVMQQMWSPPPINTMHMEQDQDVNMDGSNQSENRKEMCESVLKQIRQEIDSYTEKGSIIQKLIVIKNHFPKFVEFEKDAEGRVSRVMFDKKAIKALKIKSDIRWISRGLNTIRFKKLENKQGIMTAYVYSDPSPKKKNNHRTKRKRTNPPSLPILKEETSIQPNGPSCFLEDALYFQQLVDMLSYFKNQSRNPSQGPSGNCDPNNPLKGDIRNKLHTFVGNLNYLVRNFIELQLLQKRAAGLESRFSMMQVKEEGRVAIRQYKGPPKCKEKLDEWGQDFQRLLEQRTPLVMYYWNSTDEGFFESYSVYKSHEDALESCRLADKWAKNSEDAPNAFGDISLQFVLQTCFFTC